VHLLSQYCLILPQYSALMVSILLQYCAHMDSILPQYCTLMDITLRQYCVVMDSILPQYSALQLEPCATCAKLRILESRSLFSSSSSPGLSCLVFLDAIITSYGTCTTIRTSSARALFYCSIYRFLQVRMLCEEHTA
jgi:hypothetical protein